MADRLDKSLQIGWRRYLRGRRSWRTAVNGPCGSGETSAIADRLVITKTDGADETQSLLARLKD